MDVDEIILASGSPRRSMLLRDLGLSFRIELPDVTELEDHDESPELMVLHNAILKADCVAKKFPNALIIAADTTVALGNKVFNKPKSMAEAFAMLKELSGKTHTVYTGVCLVNESTGLRIKHCEKSQVTFLDLRDRLIQQYHSLLDPLDRAGSYSIEDHRDMIIKSHVGSLSNIIGLPIEFLSETLHNLGYLKRADK